MKILIAGGTGTIGKVLAKHLTELGYEVRILSRMSSIEPGIQKFGWDVETNQVDKKAFENIDALINLVGEAVADKPWTDQRKKQIIDSRVNSTKLLFETCQRLEIKPSLFICASAVGFYGYSDNLEKIFSEDEKCGDDFLAHCCSLWETEANRFSTIGIRTVMLRFAMVLERDGGALKKILPLAKAGILSPLGNGKQIMPWIHVKDLCGIVELAINDQSLTGPVNTCAPEQSTNKSFFQTLTKVIKKPFFFPSVPSFVMRILYGGRSEILLKGNKVDVSKLAKHGFNFKFPSLESALKDFF